jgi:hypothetical protein
LTDAEIRGAVTGTSYELVVGDDIVSAPPRKSALGVETLRDEHGDVLAWLWSSGRDRVMQMPGVATFACSHSECRVTAATEPGVSEAEVTQAFHKFVVPLLLYFQGHELLHASAVQGPNGIVGFCGEAGTGKSTLAYGLSTRGFALWADDALALELGNGPRAFVVPFALRLRPASLKFFEASSSRPVPPAEGGTAPVVGLATITQVAAEKDVARIERLTGGRAFHEVVRHSYRAGLRTDHGRRQTLVENYMKIVASVPVFEIAFQPGFERFAAVLDVVAEWLDAEFAQVA